MSKDTVCTACEGTGQMGGAICAHCEEEDEAHAEDVWEEDEDIARDRQKYPEKADFE
jgi:hypothetical protein